MLNNWFDTPTSTSYFLSPQPRVANIATLPCLISVSRRLSAKCEVTATLESSQQCRATYNALPLEHLDVVVLGETQRVPKAQGGLVADKALKASAANCSEVS